MNKQQSQNSLIIGLQRLTYFISSFAISISLFNILTTLKPKGWYTYHQVLTLKIFSFFPQCSLRFSQPNSHYFPTENSLVSLPNASNCGLKVQTKSLYILYINFNLERVLNT